MTAIKRTVTTMALGLLAVALSPAALAAEPPVTWLMNAGYAATVGQTSDYMQGGWTVGGGMNIKFEPSSPLSAQFDLSYANFQATNNLINLGQAQSQFRIDDGRGDIWSLTAAGKYTASFSNGVRGYGLLGIGAYHRYVELTQTALGSGYVCDPWWGYCYPALVEGDVVVANKSQTKFGWNVGVGLEFPLRYGGAWFLEARYHWIDGDKQTEILPIQIGYRF
jgi:opacity protein-like surface antigen